MSSIFGTSNDYGSLFGDYSSSSNNNSSMGIFGNSGGLLGEYSMIKSGAYKKLLRSYYKNSTDTSSKTDSKADSTTKDNSVETGKLLTVKTDSSALKEAADKLGDRSLYQPTGKDENGRDVYDMDKIKKNVKDFIKTYNSYIDSSSSVDTKGVLSKSLSIVKNTASNEKLLKSIGIKIGEGNKLSLDEEKFDEANISTLYSIFTGRFSYGGVVADKAGETYSAANSASYSNTGASSYTYKGSYSVMGTKNNSLDAYL